MGRDAIWSWWHHQSRGVQRINCSCFQTWPMLRFLSVSDTHLQAPRWQLDWQRCQSHALQKVQSLPPLGWCGTSHQYGAISHLSRSERSPRLTGDFEQNTQFWWYLCIRPFEYPELWNWSKVYTTKVGERHGSIDSRCIIIYIYTIPHFTTCAHGMQPHPTNGSRSRSST